MRITSKGQVTIPIEIREKLGLLPNTAVEFELRGNTVRIKRAEPVDGGRGRALVAHMKGRGTSQLTTDQIMALTRS